jgi:hypothetical protein
MAIRGQSPLLGHPEPPLPRAAHMQRNAARYGVDLSNLAR